MNKIHIKKCKKVLVKIFIVAFIILATVAIVYYAKGYRISLDEQKILNTGVLNIETEPTRAHFYINEDFTGRTSRTVSSIPQGEYTLNLWLDDYHDLSYDIEIFPEKSTTINTFMFRKIPSYEIQTEVPSKILKSEKVNNSIFTLSSDEENNDIFRIYKYQGDTPFWQFGNKDLEEIFEFVIDTETNEIDNLEVSPNQKFAIIEITNGEDEEDDEKITEENLIPSGKHIISFETQNVLTKIEDNDKELRWSNDGLSIFWLKDKVIYKLNLEEFEDTKEVYQKPDNMEIMQYNTDNNGNLHILYKIDENDFATLAKIDNEGEESYIIEKIYYQTKDHFLDTWKEKDFIEYKTFKNSPQSTLFVGKPKNFHICQNTQQVVIETDNALYTYNIEDERYSLINPFPSEFINFSPDHNKIGFFDTENEKVGTFIFDREIGNYSLQLGAYYISSDIEREECDDFAWHSDSLNIFYSCKNSLYVNDIQGFNEIKLIPFFGEKITVEGDDTISTILKKENIDNKNKILDTLDYQEHEEIFREIHEKLEENKSILLEAQIN